MYTIGIDIGSTATKGVVYNGSISGEIIIPTGWDPRSASKTAYESLLKNNDIKENSVKSIIATGYGRVSAEFATRTVTEITCHAYGAFCLNPNIRTVIDIGGQDSKVIRTDKDGRVIDFIMNDKCAAGTGRFLEVMARILELEITDFDNLCANCEAQPISSMCTVFAESEVISLLARGIPRGNIVRGILESIAERMITLVNRLDVAYPVAFTGGLAQSRVLKNIIGQHIGEALYTSPSAQLTGALGGAAMGWHRDN